MGSKKWTAFGLIVLTAIAVLVKRDQIGETRNSEVPQSTSSTSRLESDSSVANVNQPSEKSATAAATDTITNDMIVSEAIAMDRIDPNPKATEQRLKEMAHNLTEKGRQFLAEKVLDSDAIRNERRVAMYLLRNCPKTSNEIYLRIANLTSNISREAPAAHTAEESNLLMTQTLVVDALEALQDRAFKREPELRGDLARVGAAANDRTIKYLVAQTLQALESGKKFKLNIL